VATGAENHRATGDLKRDLMGETGKGTDTRQRLVFSSPSSNAKEEISEMEKGVGEGEYELRNIYQRSNRGDEK